MTQQSYLQSFCKFINKCICINQVDNENLYEPIKEATLEESPIPPQTRNSSLKYIYTPMPQDQVDYTPMKSIQTTYIPLQKNYNNNTLPPFTYNNSIYTEMNP